jgi:hypothetical protein
MRLRHPLRGQAADGGCDEEGCRAAALTSQTRGPGALFPRGAALAPRDRGRQALKCATPTGCLPTRRRPPRSGPSLFLRLASRTTSTALPAARCAPLPPPVPRRRLPDDEVASRVRVVAVSSHLAAQEASAGEPQLWLLLGGGRPTLVSTRRSAARLTAPCPGSAQSHGRSGGAPHDRGDPRRRAVRLAGQSVHVVVRRESADHRDRGRGARGRVRGRSAVGDHRAADRQRRGWGGDGASLGAGARDGDPADDLQPGAVRRVWRVRAAGARRPDVPRLCGHGDGAVRPGRQRDRRGG